METTAKGWNVLDRDRAILWREYSFGGGVATTFVFRGAGDGLVVVSPCSGIDKAALDELSTFGNVAALLACNSYHWLGQQAWREHFPKARSFAPAQGIERLTKKVPGVSFEPLAALEPLLGDGPKVFDAPGLKVGSVIATVGGGKGKYLYASDFLANIPALPTQFVFRILMSMTDSAPGYKLFRPAVWLQVKNKNEFRGWMNDLLEKTAPTTVVPAHGPPMEGTDLVAQTRALLAKM